LSDEPGVPYDPFDEAVLANPFPSYAALRDRCPVHHFADFGDSGFFSVSRYEDVVSLSKDVDRWSAEWGQGPIYVREGGLRSDPPEHTIYRQLINRAFTPRRAAELEPFVRVTAQQLIDGCSSRRSVDLVDALAAPLPLLVIAHLLGVPAERVQEFKAWSDEFMEGQNNADPAVQGEARAKIDAFFTEELNLRRDLLEGHAGDPLDVLGDDILTSLLLAESDSGRRFTNEQLLPLLLLLLVGGNETTTSLIGNLVRRLLEEGLWETVAANESSWDAAIEESLRYDPPVLGLFRTARGNQQLHDVDVPDGAKVQGLCAAANRDPGVWSDPETFRLDRSTAEARKHLSFGAGIWFCPGAALARLEARIVLELLSKQWVGLRIDGPPVRTGSFMMWGLAALPLAWDA
jgi:cytochrome P450